MAMIAPRRGIGLLNRTGFVIFRFFRRFTHMGSLGSDCAWAVSDYWGDFNE